MESIKSGIYIIRNTFNNKVYIGSSKDIKRRIQDHLYLLRKGIHGNIILQRSFDRYGECVFEFEILEECNIDELLEREKYYIDLYDSRNKLHGYNIAKIIKTDGFYKSSMPKFKLNNNKVKCIKLLLSLNLSISFIASQLRIQNESVRLIKIGASFTNTYSELNKYVEGGKLKLYSDNLNIKDIIHEIKSINSNIDWMKRNENWSLISPIPLELLSGEMRNEIFEKC